MPVATKYKNPHNLKCGKFSLNLGQRTHVMGVLNRTPDSFSDGGQFLKDALALRRIQDMVREGADIIDIGGESTRPGSNGVSLSEELARTIPIIREAVKEIDIPISIDTSKHEVALRAIQAGASLVNDITGLKSDPKMAEVIAFSGAAVCVMHMKGAPRDMQDNPVYEDLMEEIVDGLRESVEIARAAGISPDKIIVDPGIGFGKTVEHNLEIINRLESLTVLQKPVLIGTSRKSFIGNILNKGTEERIFGTAVTCAFAISNGASIIRVHDVGEMVDVARMTDGIKKVGCCGNGF
ncbi:MAG: dihydropteroate synthase [Candidatus Omnitrophica bacterium]|nr:dihydropteroate synthase [Candidatus Omnitrophota bacterium]